MNALMRHNRAEAELNDYLAAYTPAQDAWAPKPPGEVMAALSAVYDRAYRDGQNGTYNNRYTTKHTNGDADENV